MPFDYTRMVFTGVFGYLFLNESPKESSAIGYILIALSGIALIIYETKKRSSKEKLLDQE